MPESDSAFVLRVEDTDLARSTKGKILWRNFFLSLEFIIYCVQMTIISYR